MSIQLSSKSGESLPESQKDPKGQSEPAKVQPEKEERPEWMRGMQEHYETHHFLGDPLPE